MRAQPPSILHPAPARGFTLLEILLVMVIIGIVLSFAALSFGPGGQDDRVAEEGRRLAALLEMAREQAVFQSQTIGVRLDDDGYTFSVWTPDGWIALTGDPLLRAREWPPELQWHLEMGADALDSDDSDMDTDTPLPQIWLSPSGEVTPFVLQLRWLGDDRAYQVRAAPDGTLQQGWSEAA